MKINKYRASILSDSLKCRWLLGAIAPRPPYINVFLSIFIYISFQKNNNMTVWGSFLFRNIPFDNLEGSLGYYSPTLKSGGYTGFALSVLLLFFSICHSVIILFFFNILRMNGPNLTKFCIHMVIDKIYIGIVNRHFSQICNRVTTLDWCQNSVFVQYLENRWTEFNQILFTHYH